MESPATVLVVDDNPQEAAVGVETLEWAGFRVHTARSAGVALDTAQAVAPDVVVLEPLLEDAWEVAAWLRRRERRGPALVALTRGPWDVNDCRNAGFDYLVLKSDDPRTLLAAVAMCVPSDGEG